MQHESARTTTAGQRRLLRAASARLAPRVTRTQMECVANDVINEKDTLLIPVRQAVMQCFAHTTAATARRTTQENANQVPTRVRALTVVTVINDRRHWRIVHCTLPLSSASDVPVWRRHSTHALTLSSAVCADAPPTLSWPVSPAHNTTVLSRSTTILRR